MATKDQLEEWERLSKISPRNIRFDERSELIAAVPVLIADVERLTDALRDIIAYAELVGSKTDDVHIAVIKQARRAVQP